MKFLADGMLGKLARWLRMLGQDVIYSTQLNDNELLGLAKAECRVLLTKDFETLQTRHQPRFRRFDVEGKTEVDG